MINPLQKSLVALPLLWANPSDHAKTVTHAFHTGRAKVAASATTTLKAPVFVLAQDQDDDTTETPPTDKGATDLVDVVLESRTSDGQLMERVGRNVFNNDARQTLSSAVSPGQTQTYLVHIKNMGQSSTSFKVSLGGLLLSTGAETAWAPTGWTATATLQNTTTDVLTPLQSAQGWETPWLSTGEETVIKLDLTAPTSTAPPVPVGSFRVVARKGTKSDGVVGKLASQFLVGIEWSLNGETWHPVTGPLSIPKLQGLGLHAIAADPELGWAALPNSALKWTITEPWEPKPGTLSGEMIWLHAEDEGIVFFVAQSGAQISGQTIITPELP